MKKILILTLFIAFSLESCKKNSPIAPVNTLSATINGVDETFNTDLYAQNGSSIALRSALSILGANGSASSADVLSITLNTNSTITPGTYTNSPNGNQGFVSITFNNGPLNLANPNAYTSDVHGNYLTTVIITAITSTNVQGTFNGQLVSPDGKTLKAFTNGKFNINLLN